MRYLSIVLLLLFTGGDFWPPLAIVIAGGVGLSAILSLVLTPAAYRLLAGALQRAESAPSGSAVATQAPAA